MVKKVAVLSVRTVFPITVNEERALEHQAMARIDRPYRTFKLPPDLDSTRVAVAGVQGAEIRVNGADGVGDEIGLVAIKASEGALELVGGPNIILVGERYYVVRASFKREKEISGKANSVPTDYVDRDGCFLAKPG